MEYIFQEDEIYHIGPSDVQDFIENYVKERWEKMGCTNVSVGSPFPYGPEVFKARKEERIVVTISHSEGEAIQEYLLWPLLEACIRHHMKIMGVDENTKYYSMLPNIPE